MPQFLQLQSFHESKGSLTVLEDNIPFAIKRVFYIYNVDYAVRGNHRHHKTIQAAICIKGSCRISNDNGNSVEHFLLDHPEKCLILYPEDYHWMYDFSEDAILLVLASELYDPKDYIYEPYRAMDSL
ncbi:sugar 3,4-ketoisomerase [Flavobacterium sp.]|uniref:sugar 3,4-ketoisomerase n=1 Tax=Flavobacterium sp. TaxID=239 RepID=UPI003D1194E6